MFEAGGTGKRPRGSSQRLHPLQVTAEPKVRASKTDPEKVGVDGKDRRAPGRLVEVRLGAGEKKVHPKRVAVVTGAGTGMGLETCRQLAAQGFTVVLTSRNSKAGKKLAETLRGEGLDIIHHRLDVTQPQSARQLAGFIEHTYGRVDVLVNNAGACLEPISDVNKPGARSLLDVSDEILQQTVLTNAMGPLYVARALAGMMRQRQSGRIINITSRMGALSEMGTGIPAYRFSKGVLNLITCMLAAELREQGIKVNAVDPGWVKTSMGGFERAPKSVEEGVDTTIWLATMKDGDEVPSGRCFRDRQPAEW